MTNSKRCIAVIGIGPRGLGALEALAKQAEDAGVTIDVDLFDPSSSPGAGPNFDPDQSAHCLLNLPVREISLLPPEYSGTRLGDFCNYASSAADPDSYPSRAQLGRYLVARYEEMAGNAPNLRLCRHKSKVQRISRSCDGWWLELGSVRSGPYEEVLLTQGQPETLQDDQLACWRSHAGMVNAALHPAYPANALLDAARRWGGRTVAIRGLGLSTFDVLRLLTCGLGGRFDAGHYYPSGHEPSRFVPFSLNGQPPVPKPAFAALDAGFDPTPAEAAAFEKALGKAIFVKPERALHQITDALVAPALRILDEAGSDAREQDVQAWMAIERQNPGAQETLASVDMLRIGIRMAAGIVPPSPGYVIGQLWRKLQSQLRGAFNPERVDALTAKAIIDFDEGLKRFSYGPPIRSARELLILINARMVDLRAADDPDFELVDEGWRLIDGNASVTATVMIDAVMPPPEVEKSRDPVIMNLMDEGRLCSVARGLGAQVRADGQLIGQDGGVQSGLCLLGRLALGSVIAVDSIHDCVGAATDRWAEGVVTRMRQWVDFASREEDGIGQDGASVPCEGDIGVLEKRAELQ